MKARPGTILVNGKKNKKQFIVGEKSLSNEEETKRRERNGNSQKRIKTEIKINEPVWCGEGTKGRL